MNTPEVVKSLEKAALKGLSIKEDIARLEEQYQVIGVQLENKRKALEETLAVLYVMDPNDMIRIAGRLYNCKLEKLEIING